MTIEIKTPELEALIQKRLKNGHFHDVDELLSKALQALPEESNVPVLKQPKKNLAQFLLDSPLPGSGLTIVRQKDSPRPIEL